MPIQFKRKVSKASRSLRINLPTEIANVLHIKNGDTLLIQAKRGQVVMRKTKAQRVKPKLK
jgi:bifunctional DNA-binding transcriptional regulator/antitoxin component of YhaV-PrlF toxin-antitoxin module